MDRELVVELLIKHWQFAGLDEDIAHEIYHDDAVLEFPQSGERFVGRDTFLAWRKKYPARLEFRVRKLTGNGDLWVGENLISYDGGPWNLSVNILQFRGDKVAHERIYVTQPFEAAEWRAGQAERFDPLEGLAPEQWKS